MPARLTVQVGSVASDFWGFGFEADDGPAFPVEVAAHRGSCFLLGGGGRDEGELSGYL